MCENCATSTEMEFLSDLSGGRIFLANFQFEFKFNVRFLGGWLKLFIVPPCLESNTLPFVFLYILRGTSPVIFLLG